MKWNEWTKNKIKQWQKSSVDDSGSDSVESNVDLSDCIHKKNNILIVVISSSISSSSSFRLNSGIDFPHCLVWSIWPLFSFFVLDFLFWLVKMIFAVVIVLSDCFVGCISLMNEWFSSLNSNNKKCLWVQPKREKEKKSNQLIDQKTKIRYF